MNTQTLTKINNVAIQMVSDSSEKLIPIRPICDALDVDYETQKIFIIEDDILTKQTKTILVDEIETVYLPLKYVFGWLFTLKSNNTIKDENYQSFIENKHECYNLFYDYFTYKAEFIEKQQDEFTHCFLFDLKTFLQVWNLLKPQDLPPEQQTRWVMVGSVKLLPIKMTFQFTEGKDYIFAEIEFSKPIVEI